MATMLNTWVQDSNGYTVYYSRIRAKSFHSALESAKAVMLELTDTVGSFKSIDVLERAGFQWNVEPPHDRVYYLTRGGYSYYWQITETTSNELEPTIY